MMILETFTLKYKRKRTNFLLFWSIAWFAMFTISFFTKEHLLWFDFGWLTLAAIYFLLYGWHVTQQFGKVQQDKLFLHHERLRPKVIDLKKVSEVRYFAGDYIFQTAQDQIRIDTKLIDQSSLQILEGTINSYSLQVKR